MASVAAETDWRYMIAVLPSPGTPNYAPSRVSSLKKEKRYPRFTNSTLFV
jgi:hypothetical protein